VLWSFGSPSHSRAMKLCVFSFFGFFRQEG